MEFKKREIVEKPKQEKEGLYFARTKKENLEMFSSGCFLLDCVLGGGWPLGRMSNIVGDKSTGKSLLAIEACANFRQKFPKGKIIYLESEAAFDEDYASALGMPVASIEFAGNKLPDFTVESWYEHLEATLETMIKTQDPCLYIVDSLDALSDRAEKDREIDKSTFGANKPKIIGQLFRRTVKDIEKSRIHLMIISQIRDNIGVCFDYGARVWLADGSSEKIGKIVTSKLDVPILSYDTNTGQIITKRITAWHDNGSSEDFLKIIISGGRSGKRQLLVTPNHHIFTPSGERQAKDLKPGDKVLALGNKLFTEDQHTIILGSLLGDGSLRWESAERGHLRFGHCKEQAAYCEWKAQSMNCVMSTMKNEVVWADTARCEEFQMYRDLQIKKHRTSIPQKYIDMLTVKSVAIWYMDDGTFKGQSTKYWGNGGCQICSKNLDFETLSKIALKLEELGLGKATVTYGKGLRWYGKESGKFQQGIAQYIHPNIRYKIKAGLPEFNWTVNKCESSLMIVESVVVSTNPTKRLNDRKRHRYDLTIEDCHSYIVDGVIVHNSFGETKTRTGGRAMDFYASQILWLSQLKRLDKTVRKQKRVYGIQVKALCKKNKIGLPFREAEFPILFGYGVDETEAMLAWLESIDVDTKIWDEYKEGRNTLAQSIKLLPKVERNLVLEKIKIVVAENWEEIETRFLPTVSKY